MGELVKIKISRLEMMQSIQDVLVENTNITKTKISKQRNIYMMIYAGKQNFIKITDYLYNNSNIYLNRKFNLYYSTLTQ